jgi:hypothetical protein
MDISPEFRESFVVEILALLGSENLWSVMEFD